MNRLMRLSARHVALMRGCSPNPALDGQVGAVFVCGTLGWDLWVRLDGSLAARTWEWADEDDYSRLAPVDDYDAAARMLLFGASYRPELEEVIRDLNVTVGCRSCRTVLTTGILVLDCSHHGP